MLACPDEDAWLDFLARERSTSSDLDAHLTACMDCRALLAALTRSATSIAEEGPPSLPRAQTAASGRIGALVAGKWRIEALAGSGGMGHVYRARHHNGHPVAIKFLHPELAGRPEVVRRFRREGYVANRVGHPAVRVLDDGDDDGPFLVMELLEGRSCRTKLREEGPLTAAEAIAIVTSAGRAVAAAHREGIVHRDIKPDNIFITTAGEVRLLDFGLAAVKSSVIDESMTADGMTLGTIGYMAPEQARGDNSKITPRADVWSLAATCVALMTGRPIHGGRTPAEELAFAITKEVPAVRSLVPGLSSEVARVLDRALSFDANKRQADAGELADELARCRIHEPPPRKRWASAGVIAATGAVIAIALSRISPLPIQRKVLSAEKATTAPSSSSTTERSAADSPPPGPPPSADAATAPPLAPEQRPAPRTNARSTPPHGTPRPAPGPTERSSTRDENYDAGATPAPIPTRDPLLPRF